MKATSKHLPLVTAAIVASLLVLVGVAARFSVFQIERALASNKADRVLVRASGVRAPAAEAFGWRASAADAFEARR